MDPNGNNHPLNTDGTASKKLLAYLAKDEGTLEKAHKLIKDAPIFAVGQVHQINGLPMRVTRIKKKSIELRLNL